MNRFGSGAANMDLRKAIMSHGLYMWQVARMCGVTDVTFSKWMREEMPPDDPRRKRIMQALAEAEQETG